MGTHSYSGMTMGGFYVITAMDLLQKHLTDTRVWVPTIVCLISATILYKYYVNYYNYWARRGVKGKRPFFIFGELYELLFTDRISTISQKTKKYGKIWGTFMMGNPRLVIADPEVMRQICIRDFDAFQNHHLNPWANKYQKEFLVWLQDDHWKRVRATMSPSFTSGKIKRMFKLLDCCSDDLVDNFKEQYIDARRGGLKKATVELFNTYSMYTMDGITTCCYGLKLKREKGLVDLKKASTRNSLVKDCNLISKFSMLGFLALALIPKPILKAMNFAASNESNYKPLKNRVEKLLEIRRQGGRSRFDDLLQMIVDAKLDDKLELNDMDQAENHHAGLTQDSIIKDQENLRASFVNGKDSKSNDGAQDKMLLSDHEILSEAIFLLIAGLDTTRSSMSTITYLLAHNQDVQERLYNELKAIAKFEETAMGKRLTFEYDDLTACHYLDAVISESLRYFGPVPFIDRAVGKDYHIEKYDVSLRKGEVIFLGFHAVHNDPDYWPEPERFNPDRFMPGQREKIVPGSYAPFSMGPRHCIGMRFSLTETKLGLAKVVMNFKFDPAPGTAYPPEVNFGLGLVHAKNCKALVSLRD